MSTQQRWGTDGIFDSSLLTKNKQTRVVFSNVLAQRTEVQNNGKPFMVIQGGTVGQGGPVNTFSITAKTGSNVLTLEEFNDITGTDVSGGAGGGQ